MEPMAPQEVPAAPDLQGQLERKEELENLVSLVVMVQQESQAGLETPDP